MKHIIIVILICLLVSCNNNDRVVSEIKELMHRKIEFCKGYKEFTCKSKFSLDSLLLQELKIVTYMDKLSCSSCGVRMLRQWQHEAKQINQQIPYIVIVHSDRTSDMLYMLDTLSLDYPIMYYESDIFSEKNNLGDKLARNKTFLLNKNNEIILVGEPFGHERLTRLYKKCIDSIYCTGKMSFSESIYRFKNLDTNTIE